MLKYIKIRYKRRHLKITTLDQNNYVGRSNIVIMDNVQKLHPSAYKYNFVLVYLVRIDKNRIIIP